MPAPAAQELSAMPPVKTATEVVALGTPFGGWVSTSVASQSTGHYFAALEGVQAALTGKQTISQYSESNGVTLFNAERMGHMAPAPIYQKIGDPSTFITAMALNGVVAVDSSNFPAAYVVLQDGSMVRLTDFPDLTADIKKSPNVSSGNHSGETIEFTNNGDIVALKDASDPQVGYILWSWETSMSADIDVYRLTDGAQTNNWFSDLLHDNGNTPLLKGVPHKLCLGPDGNLYITNGSTVIQVTINGSLLSNDADDTEIGLTLSLGSDWTAIKAVPYKNYIAIIASKNASYLSGAARGEVAVFLWDGIALSPNYEYPIPDNTALNITFDGIDLLAYTAGRNNTSKIFEYTSKGFEQVFESPVFNLPANATQSIQANWANDTELVQNGVLFTAQKEDDTSHLMRFYEGGIHDEGVVTDGMTAAAQLGMVKNFFENYTYIGACVSGSTYAIYVNIPGTYQVGASLKTILYSQGILGRRQYPLGFKGTVNRFMLYLSQWGEGASLTLSLFKDWTQAVVGGATDLLNLVLDTNIAIPESINHHAFPVGTTEIDVSDVAIPDISSFYMIITWSHVSPTAIAAILRRIIAYVDPSL